MCQACKKQIFLPYKSNTRPDLQMELGGDEIKVNCNSCGKFNKKHINKITAVVDNRLIFIGTIGGIILSIMLIYYIGLIASITLSLPFIIWSYEQKKAHQFNIYRIRK